MQVTSACQEINTAAPVLAAKETEAQKIRVGPRAPVVDL